VAGEVPATVVYDDDRVMAFRDIAPQAPFHVLVVPKAHHRDLAALAGADPSLTAELMTTMAAVAQAEGLDEYRVVFNTGETAGQSVFHVHGHLLGGRSMTWPPG
jgi:histidine triad (HIT) family protein